MSVPPVDSPSHLPHLDPLGALWRERRVEPSCAKVCRGSDEYVRTGSIDPLDVPPGATPYHRYLQAQNAADAIRARSEALAPEPAPSTPTDAPKLGEVLPTEPETPASPRPERVASAHVGSGRFIDVVF